MFIEGQKFKKIKEAANNGDEKAKSILLAQYHGDDVNGLLEEFFSTPEEEIPEEPVTEVVDEEKPKKFIPLTHEQKLEKFLRDNNISKDDPEYASYVEEFEKEEPNTDGAENISTPSCGCSLNSTVEDLIADEIEAINGYDKAIIEFSQSTDLKEATIKGVIATLQSIKEEELKSLEKFWYQII